MTKGDLVKEFDRLIEAHYSEEIDSRDEWLREIIDLRYNVVKKLIIPVVGVRSEQLCDCIMPDPIDPWAEVDKFTCRKCGNLIA